MSKSGAKTAKTDAVKASRKRPDPEGLRLIEEGEKAFEAKDFVAATERFVAAKAACDASTVQATAKPKKEKPPPAEKEAVADKEPKPADGGVEQKLVLKPPVENIQAKPLRPDIDAAHNYALNAAEDHAAYLKRTGGGIRTRFPPEPNGYLHIGHAKAMNFNFGQARLAREAGGSGATVMRFDDTNPAAEKQEYIDSILDSVAWLGHTPVAVTYSSDYFPQLYDLALQLIRSDGAYVCHQTAEEIKASRMALRNYHGKENLLLFERMRTGRFGEGEAARVVTLPVACDLLSDNSSLWDPAAYRVLFHSHPRTGDEWCVYPTYDYTHCIVDSLEDISHSLCTLEFGQRQAVDGPYYWLLHALRLYKPVTWEYSRLNITHTLMSKRKLKFLVEGGFVCGWDDPRLPTIEGLRRRGFSAAMLNRFCDEDGVGVTKAAMTARWQVVEHVARTALDASAPRRSAVELRGLAAGGKPFESPNHPRNAEMGARRLVLPETIYIDRDDFREARASVDAPSFFGLAPGKEVGLLGAGVTIRCDEVVRGGDGGVTALVCSADGSAERNKTKGHLHWVSAAEGVRAKVRVYGVLFTPEDPEGEAAKLKGGGGGGDEEGEGDEADEAEAASPESASYSRADGARLGFFCVDTDSTAEAPVFNRIVPLKEDKEKKAG
ncbi:hypothetical protein EMIHUDRAFT_414809 [Emiliania huxleyi CCMP1516]|uniref:glutamine--tRNA ligase n=2 Tax=Emiliania huxleyi TaxID=2903 RepID=A0A0D3I1U2_EMIH1|nr:hypothetical protein EMIHUDRAFT_414809 [Emiliania huxleyi CCMP1516]EOD05227.1 hypothetical protein EMIHUDRAFT_414809 [Emiliania huxleyi CCMP1516]|eukprot:XP_005757656.1 hypothetical protein EMIHUDRAFT_414809 [Emiliania huxleyi CCMP1516]